MPLKLERAEPDELEAINRLVAESEAYATGCDKEEFLSRYRLNAEHLCSNLSFVLKAESQLLGFFLVRTATASHELEYFYTARECIGQGYGKRMWAHAIQVCQENAIDEFSIVCGKNVTPFYLRMGAEIIGERDSLVYPGKVVDVLKCKVTLP